ncbi:MAG: hypothetical protein AAB481_00510 [Patescibacteria group bacterium]
MKKFYEIASPYERFRNDIIMNKKLILFDIDGTLIRPALVDSLMDERVLSLLGLE